MNCRRCEGWEVQVPREAWLSGKWRARAQARPRAGGALTPPSCPRNHLLPPKRGQKSQSTGLAHSPHSPSSPSTQGPAWHPYLDRCPGTQGTPSWQHPKACEGGNSLAPAKASTLAPADPAPTPPWALPTPALTPMVASAFESLVRPRSGSSQLCASLIVPTAEPAQH